MSLAHATTAGVLHRLFTPRLSDCDDLPRSDVSTHDKNVRDQRSQLAQLIAACGQNDDSKVEATEVLLKRQVSIDGQEYVEVRLGEAQQVAIATT